MKKTILTGLTLALTALFSIGLLSAADKPGLSAKKARAAAVVATLLPPELNRSLNLIPNDAVIAGFINVEAITKGKLFSEIMKTLELDWETLLAATGGKKEDADACSLFYVKLKPQTAEAAASPIPAFEIGGAVVYKQSNVVSEQFAKSAEDIKNSMGGLDQDACEGAKVEKIKIGDKDAFMISLPAQNMTVISIAATKNIVQFRVFFNTAPVKELIPARGGITQLSSSLDLGSAFSFALDATQARAIAGEIQDDAVLQTVQFASCSITEKAKGLALVFRVTASNADGVQLIKTQIDAALAGLKDDPSFGTIAGKTTVTVEKGTDVVVRSFIPSDFIIQNLQMLGAMQQDAGEPAPAPAE